MKSRTILFAASIFILSMSCSDKNLKNENEELKGLLELKDLEMQQLKIRLDSAIVVAREFQMMAEINAEMAAHLRYEMEKMKK